MGENVPGPQEFIERINPFVDLEKTGTVFDIGAGYGFESVEFAKMGYSVHAFECNPKCLSVLLEKTRSYDSITVVGAMVVGVGADSLAPFYPINTQDTKTGHIDGNPQASSMYRANGEYPHENYVQDEMLVTTITLDEYVVMMESRPTLLWMDLQGAELDALTGGGDMLLRDVVAIHTEAELKPIYKNQSLFPAVDAFLKAHGFKEIHREPWSEYGIDIDYVREEA